MLPSNPKCAQCLSPASVYGPLPTHTHSKPLLNSQGSGPAHPHCPARGPRAEAGRRAHGLLQATEVVSGVARSPRADQQGVRVSEGAQPRGKASQRRRQECGSPWIRPRGCSRTVTANTATESLFSATQRPLTDAAPRPAWLTAPPQVYTFPKSPSDLKPLPVQRGSRGGRHENDVHRLQIHHALYHLTESLWSPCKARIVDPMLQKRKLRFREAVICPKSHSHWAADKGFPESSLGGAGSRGGGTGKDPEYPTPLAPISAGTPAVGELLRGGPLTQQPWRQSGTEAGPRMGRLRDSGGACSRPRGSRRSQCFSLV